MTTIKERADAYVAKVLEGSPGEGAGLHQWLFSAAVNIWPFRETAGDVEATIYNAISGSLSKARQREITREIRDAVRNAKAEAKAPDWYHEAQGQPITPDKRDPVPDIGPRWPRKDYHRLHSVVTEFVYPLAEVAEHSPVKITEERMTEPVLDALFPGNPLLCVAEAANHHHTAHREKWRGRLSGLPLMVPNAMSSIWGDKDTGGRSMRCNGNVGPRRYLVVEFDFAKRDRNGKPTFDIDLLNRLEAKGHTVADLCSSIIWELQFGKPILRLIVSSGGKSLHSWWDCQGLSEAEVEEFFADACALGADPATWTRCQLVRIPDGTRDDGTRQSVHLFSPAQ